MRAEGAQQAIAGARAGADAAGGRAVLDGGGVALVEVDGLGFRVAERSLVGGITMQLRSGGPTVLLGPNGSGKTTLLRLLMGLVAPSAGRMTLSSRADGSPLRRAFVFQKPVMLKRSVAANVAFALETAGREASAAVIDGLLAGVGLAGLESRPARRLSGGEQQRLALARALAREPDILMLDEPTASLDPAQSKAVEDIIANVSAAGVKVVMATHDLGQARRLARDVVLLVGGAIAERASAQDFFTRPTTEAARRFVAGDLII